MSKIIAIHSFRGGTGKSNLAANLAAIIAKEGHRVGIVDTDIQSPGIHALFGLTEADIDKALNDYLWGTASVDDVAYPVHDAADGERDFLRELEMWLIPSSLRVEEITRILQEGYSVSVLNQGLHSLIVSLGLDYLFIDTHPGINEETLLSIAISHGLIVLLRPDQQDFQGTAVTLNIARQLEVPNMRLVVNKALVRYEPSQVKDEVEANFGVKVSAVLPLSEDVADNASDNIFCMLHPAHEWSRAVRRIADDVLTF